MKTRPHQNHSSFYEILPLFLFCQIIIQWVKFPLTSSNNGYIYIYILRQNLSPYFVNPRVVCVSHQELVSIQTDPPSRVKYFSKEKIKIDKSINKCILYLFPASFVGGKVFLYRIEFIRQEIIFVLALHERVLNFFKLF